MTVTSVPSQEPPPYAQADSSLDGTPSALTDDDDAFVNSSGPVTMDGNLSPLRPSGTTSGQPDPKARRKSISVRLEKTQQAGQYLLTADETELREILRESLENGVNIHKPKLRSKFRDLVFTRQFTAFDRQNPQSAQSPFHGFYTLFWLGVAMMLLRLAANNWRVYGTIWGRTEIIRLMFHKDVLVLGITDGLMCGSTIFCLFLQKAIYKRYLRWNRSGWIIQNLWQTAYLATTLWWTYHRDWPWTHTVFIVLHCFTMLMKQHSYASYNGYLSEVYRRREIVQKKLKELDAHASAASGSSSAADPASYYNPHDLDTLQRRRRASLAAQAVHDDQNDPQVELSEAVRIVSEAIESKQVMQADQLQPLRRILMAEIDFLTSELAGKCVVTQNHYPRNLTVKDFYGFIPLPTLVYELEYPRQDKINWMYVLEKTAATFGVIFVMIAISQAWIYPVVISALRMKDEGMDLRQRLREFPWVLGDLIFPFMLEYLLSFYVIWECVLNALAELTRFADRGFYGDWWNSVSWDQFARDWNRPVHNFLLRHVYHGTISTFRLSRPSATLVTFLLSACVHELIMLCIFRRLRGYLLLLQMLQLPLVSLSRTKLLRGRRTLGNIVFWLGIFTGPSLLCSLYLII
ncbi:hypothetical protein VTN49DRAFT_3325 [Thermomyces lanuginosus]|uniref:uncharacterized protein n=1 Tax=Thermomyces lanuginosus TaxID=5541 RepID=UPI003743AE4F